MPTERTIIEPDEERWECQIPGRIWVSTRDYDGRPLSRSVHGVGATLRLRKGDRIRAQEAIREVKRDPFRNGMLVRMDANQSDDVDTVSSDALTRAELADVFALGLDDFREYVASLSEVNLRRLSEMTTEVDASLNKTKFLSELIAERYPIGKDTPTYREMQSDRAASQR